MSEKMIVIDKLKSPKQGRLYINSELVDMPICVNDYVEYKKIEKELGIDLITFVKVTTQSVLYIKNTPYSNEIKLAMLIGIHKNDVPNNSHYLIWFQVNEKERYLLNLKDYGKTYALTKEELL